MSSGFLYSSNTFTPYNYPLEEAKVVFLGIPFSSTAISESSIFGPVMVRESLKMIEPIEPKTGKNFAKEKICDIGNIEIVPGSYEITAERITETIREVKNMNPEAFLISIGGDHLITLPVVDVLKPKTIIQLDAHSDIKKDYMGNMFSHTTWAYHAKKSINCDLIQIGVREKTQEENLANELGIGGINGIEKAKEPIYITIDMDVFDPPYVETGFPVSGGMTPKEVFGVIEKLGGKKMLGIDIVEITSRQLPSKTGFLAAELIRKIISLL